MLETDLLHLGSNTNLVDNICWGPQVYNITANASRGVYGKDATSSNIITNPFPASDAVIWSGQGINGGDPGLQLWVSGSLIDNMVPMAEIVSKRNDMLYGSFRVGMKITGIPGTCGAFFFASFFPQWSHHAR